MEKVNNIIDKLAQDIDSKSNVLKSCYTTLRNNHNAISYFEKSMEKNYEPGEAILRLYGLLQALFVCIDSLYTMTFKITGTKNFININDNKALRELKYIRNDVVGHPTNRIVDDKTEYAILNPNDIKSDEFTYSVFSDVEYKKHVVFNDLVKAYKDEAFKLLNALDAYVTSSKTPYLLDDAINIYETFLNGEDIRSHLSLFKKKYNEGNSNSRIFKRIRLVTRLFTDFQKNPDGIKRYVTGYHLYKLCSVVAVDEDLNSMIKPLRLPNALSKIFQFFDDNPLLIHHFECIYDANHPMFYSSIEQIIKAAKKAKNKTVSDYFEKIKEAAYKHDNEYVYAYASILREYKGKKKK